jgi:excisionase family DNA binding protein
MFDSAMLCSQFRLGDCPLDDQWYTVEEIAKQLKVHEQTVRRWLRDGSLRGRSFGGKTGWRVRDRDLRAFLDVEPEKAAA